MCKACYSRHWKAGTLDGFVGSLRKRVGCSINGCGGEHYGRGMCKLHWARPLRSRWRKPEHSDGRGVGRTCDECGSPFVARRSEVERRKGRFCSHACFDAVRRDPDARRESARRGRRRRRARLAGVESDDYTLAEVAERDGWRCGICLKRVGRSYSSTHPRGPTIDHIVPIAGGGDDTFANVQLAHRECNIRKSWTGPGQLRLVADGA